VTESSEGARFADGAGAEDNSREHDRCIDLKPSFSANPSHCSLSFSSSALTT